MEPTKKSPEIRRIQSELMQTNVPEAIQQDRCVRCEGAANKFSDERSRREFAISGLCQNCQDDIFNMLAAISEEEKELE